MKRWHASQRLPHRHLGLEPRRHPTVRRVVMLMCPWGNTTSFAPTGFQCLASRLVAYVVACTVPCTVTDVAGLLNRLVDRQHDDLQQVRAEAYQREQVARAEASQQEERAYQREQSTRAEAYQREREARAEAKAEAVQREQAVKAEARQREQEAKAEARAAAKAEALQ